MLLWAPRGPHWVHMVVLARCKCCFFSCFLWAPKFWCFRGLFPPGSLCWTSRGFLQWFSLRSVLFSNFGWFSILRAHIWSTGNTWALFAHTTSGRADQSQCRSNPHSLHHQSSSLAHPSSLLSLLYKWKADPSLLRPPYLLL